MKFILALLIIFTTSLNSFAIESPLIPQWEEFCPMEFLDVTYKHPGKVFKNRENNYWAKRRKSFYNSIQNCKNLYKNNLNSLNSCYSNIRNIEINKSWFYKKK